MNQAAFKRKLNTGTVLFAIAVLALVVRLYHLDRYPLWFDESAAALEPRSVFALPSVTEFFNPEFTRDRADYLMLYYHGFVFFWRELVGNSVFSLRVSSVIWALLGIGMVYKLASYLYGRNVGLMSAFLLSLAPFHIYYSQELRQYTAVMFLCLISYYLVFRILEFDRSRDWISLIIVNTVIVYFHYVMIILLGAEIMLFVLYRRRIRHALLKIAGGSFIFLIFVFPVLLIVVQKVAYILTHTVRADISDFPIWGGKIDFRNVVYTLRNFSIGYTVDFYSVWGWIATCLLVDLCILGLIRGGAANNFSSAKRVSAIPPMRMREVSLIVLFVFPIAALFIFSQAAKTCYVDRYFFPLGALYCIAVSAGICSARKFLKIFLTVCVCICFGVGLSSYYRDDLPRDNAQHIGYMQKNTHIDEITAALARNYREGDQVMSASRLITLPLKFYMNAYSWEYPSDKNTRMVREANEGKLFWVDNEGKPFLISYNKIVPTWYDKKPFSEKEMSPRIWLIYYTFDPRPEVMADLSKRYEQKAKFLFGDSELYEYEKRVVQQ
ncbi:MAG: glycosyltransferase family 39 protein [Candidatus Omnitrophica bacterium]|nr:glycosyltransferase family 39 protein [Candidatus Omnitrophota bacterium]